MQIIEVHVNQLMEHFDTVQIFVTRHEPATLNGTVRADLGGGNWYARYGQAKEWLVIQDERAKQTERTGE